MTDKLRIAFFSPLNPRRSGISDYSEELLPFLAARGFEIDLYVDGFKPTNRALLGRFAWFDYKAEPSRLGGLPAYDAVVYHVGNDHRYHAGIYDAARATPGLIVLHDFSLQHFFLGLARERGDSNVYLDEVAACEGAGLRAEAEEAMAGGAIPAIQADPASFPLNCRLVNSAEALIVHSEWSRARLRRIAPAVPVRRINMHVLPDALAKTHEAAGGGARRVELASFGHVTTEKGIGRTLRVLAGLRASHDFHYTLVGQPDNFDVEETVRAHGLRDRVTITGFVSLEEFQRRIAETDIAVNLRDRTVGETSASVCRVMAAGVPVVISNVGWFAELPDDAAVKVEPGETDDASLRASLSRLIDDAALRRRIGANARRHVLDQHSIEKSAAAYAAFIRETVARRARRRLIRRVSSEFATFGLKTTDERLLRGVAAEITRIAPSDFTPDGQSA
ncbi:MAG: glycosyltransferase family 4 protein [Acidobacteria bacterium]|nr:glycosyltransferase family 4 protein [Acidobacteriota bacterium]